VKKKKSLTLQKFLISLLDESGKGSRFFKTSNSEPFLSQRKQVVNPEEENIIESESKNLFFEPFYVFAEKKISREKCKFFKIYSSLQNQGSTPWSEESYLCFIG